MNRRTFFKKLGVGVAVAAVAPSALALLEESTCVAAPTVGYHTYIMGKEAIIGSYADYTNFSGMALAKSLDEAVSQSAVELGEAAGLSIKELAIKEASYDPNAFKFFGMS